MATANVATLRRLCPALADVVAQRAGEPAKRVMVLTETLDHALTLAKLLPGWQIAVDPQLAADALTVPERQMLSSRPPTIVPSQKLIATVAGLRALVSMAGVDVLISAGGGPYRPPLQPIDLACYAGEVRPLYVVDVHDRHHPQLRRWSRDRRHDCAAAEWLPVGADHVAARIDRFLVTRPEMIP